MKTSKIIITTIILLALISLGVPKGSCLDVSCRAIKARESNEYSPHTAWEYFGYTGNGITIAFIDWGIDEEHEALAGKFVAGVDFTVTGIGRPKDGSYNPPANDYHGTFTASIALGTGGSEGKYRGVAPEARLIDIKIKPIAYTTRDIADAVEWCIQHKDTQWGGQPPGYWGIDIISCSMGSGEENNGLESLAVLANKAVEEGIVFIAASGNEGPDNNGFESPASADKVITVSAIDDKNTVNRGDDDVPDWSNRGLRADDDDDPYDELKPDVVAPGVDITAAKYDTEDEYREGSGTSFSSPHVAGVVALMLEANPDLKPTPDKNPIQEILRKTAESRGTPDSDLGYEGSDSYYNYSYGWGIVDAYEAVKAALAWTPPPEPNILPSISIANPKNNAEVSGIITISGTALDTDGNVTSVELKIDENNWFNVSIIPASSLEWNYTWDTKNVENGKHTIYAMAYDGENHSVVQSVDVNVYNEVSAGGVEEETKINPVYLITGVGIIGAVVIVVVCVLLFRRRKMPGAVSAVPPPVTGVPSVTAQCPNCRNIIEITSAKRPVKVKCPKCGAKSILR